VSLSAQQWQHRLHHEQRAKHIHPHHQLQIVSRKLLNRPGDHRAGIVDEDIDAPPCPPHPVGGAAGGTRVRDIGGHDQGAPASADDALGHLREEGAPTRCQGHRSALASEGQRRLATNAARGSRHHHDLVGKRAQPRQHTLKHHRLALSQYV
jgi:hypothetical protein